MANNNNIDWGGWILTIIMLGLFWPVGLILLFRQLKGYTGRGQAKRHPYDLERERQAANSANYQWNVVQPGQTGGTTGAPNTGTVGAAPPTGTAYNPNAYRAAPNAGAAYNPNAARTGQAPGAGYNYTYRPPQTAQTSRTAQTAQTSRTAQTAQTARSSGGSWDAVKKTTPDRKEAKVKGKGGLLTFIGAALSATFGLATIVTMSEFIADLVSGYGISGYLIQPMFLFTGFFGAGLMCLYAGHRKRKQAKRYKKYLAYIGKNTEISISSLASAMGVKDKVVYEDLQDMLDNGVLPMGYIDVALGQLVLSDAGIAQRAPQPEPEPQPVKKVVEDENAILQEIREVNDAIPDAAMSAKIDRIGEITGKILDYQRSHPSKSNQLRSFLNYYLPTTLKILRAYAQLDAQGIEGENITAAKKRIESMMDQVVDGFEKQLDKLFADDALDITADVAVLENMLRKDGLSGGMILDGGPAVGTVDGFSPQQSYLDLQKVADELDAQSKAKDDGQITLQL